MFNMVEISRAILELCLPLQLAQSLLVEQVLYFISSDLSFDVIFQYAVLPQ